MRTPWLLLIVLIPITVICFELLVGLQSGICSRC